MGNAINRSRTIVRVTSLSVDRVSYVFSVLLKERKPAHPRRIWSDTQNLARIAHSPLALGCLFSSSSSRAIAVRMSYSQFYEMLDLDFASLR